MSSSDYVCIVDCQSFYFLTIFRFLCFVLFFSPEISEDEAEDRLQEAIQEKFAVFGDVCAVKRSFTLAYYPFLALVHLINIANSACYCKI